MGLIEKLQEILTIKNNIKTSIESKNVTVGNKAFSEYPNLIKSIQSGGGSGGAKFLIEYPAYLFYYGLRGKTILENLFETLINCTPIYYNSFYGFDEEIDLEVPINYMIENHNSIGTNTYYKDYYNCAILHGAFANSNLKNITLNLKKIDTVCFLYQSFYNCKKLISVSANTNIVRTNYLNNCFQNCSNLEQINFTLDLNGCASASSAFYGCSKLKEVNFVGRLVPTIVPYSTSPYKTLNSSYSKGSSCTIASIFYNCTSIEKITGLDLTNVGTATNPFYNCTSLTTLDFSGTENVQVNIDLKTTGLNATGLMNMLNTLPDISNSTSRTLTIGDEKMALLTEEQQAEFAAKGYSLA